MALQAGKVADATCQKLDLNKDDEAYKLCMAEFSGEKPAVFSLNMCIYVRVAKKQTTNAQNIKQKRKTK